MMVATTLSCWSEGAAKAAIVEFVEETVAAAVPIEERVATFDVDGTLWCEKPMPAQLVFILRRLTEMAAADAMLRDRQPWKAAYTQDHEWMATAMTEHYAGDDAKARAFLAGVGAAFAGTPVEDFAAESESFLRTARHPTLGCGYPATAYAPMLELLAYLRAHNFSTHLVSGSGGDFIRPIAGELFGIPLERVIGSASVLDYTSDDRGGTISHNAALGVLDDGAQKPIQIWTRVGRRPLLAGGNSNGDLPMLEFARHEDRPTLRLLVLHDDAEREFAYTSGAEEALEKAYSLGWTVISMRHDFETVFL